MAASDFAQSLPEFELGLPPESNANFAFILKSFYVADEALLTNIKKKLRL